MLNIFFKLQVALGLSLILFIMASLSLPSLFADKTSVEAGPGSRMAKGWSGNVFKKAGDGEMANWFH